MICLKCYRMNDDDATACVNCGAKLQKPSRKVERKKSSRSYYDADFGKHDGLCYIVFFACAPLGLLFAWLTPDNILNNPIAYHFTHFMAMIAPCVKRTGSLAPDSAAQFLVAVYTAVGFISIVSLLYYDLKVDRENTLRIWSAIPEEDIYLGVRFLCIACLGWVVFFPIATETEQSMVDHKWLMGIKGCYLYSGSSFVAAKCSSDIIAHTILTKRRWQEKKRNRSSEQIDEVKK